MPSYNYDGDHSTSLVEIVSHNGEKYNIYHSIQKIEIYEDMFGNCMTGKLYIDDTNNMPMQMPIMGNEKVRIDVELPNVAPKTYEFIINSLTDRTRSGDGIISYVIHLISACAVKNSNTYVSKGYKLKKYTEMISELHGKYSSKGISFSSPSEGLKTVVVPNMRPQQAINWLLKYAVDEVNLQPSYMYFERQDGYWCKTLEDMLGKGPKQKFKLGRKDQRGIDNNKEAYHRHSTRDALIVDRIDYESQFDILDSIQSGMWGSQVTLHDWEYKKFTVETYDYMSEFNGVKKPLHLKSPEGPMPAGNPDVTSAISSPDAIHNIAHFRNNFDGLNRTKIDKNQLIRDARLKEFDFFKVVIEVAGTIFCNTGDVIELDLKSIQEQDPDSPDIPEKYQIGKFLITSMAHHITPERFTTVIECATDTLATKFDDVPKYMSNKADRESEGAKV